VLNPSQLLDDLHYCSTSSKASPLELLVVYQMGVYQVRVHVALRNLCFVGSERAISRLEVLGQST